MSTESKTDKSIRNEQRLRAAMDRLLAGKPLHTDGRLTVKNLATEAGLTRQQAYRCEAITKEFAEHVQRISERGEEPAERHLQRISRLREQLAEEKARSARYRTERDEARATQQTLANQLRVLDEQNRRLEAQLADQGKVTRLR